jgi:hypothetical protein
MGIDGNETAHQLAREDSSRPLIGPKPALGISAKVVREVIRDWTSRKQEEHMHSTVTQRSAMGFLKEPSVKKSQGTAQSEQKPAKNNDRVANRTLSLKRTFI